MAARLVLESELAEVDDDDICPVRPEIGDVIAASDAHYEPEPAGTSRFHTDEGVFEDDSASRRRLEAPGRFQKRVRRRLAPQSEPAKVDAVDTDVEELGKACCGEHFGTVPRR
jgi:hypothetical protein